MMHFGWGNSIHCRYLGKKQNNETIKSNYRYYIFHHDERWKDRKHAKKIIAIRRVWSYQASHFGTFTFLQHWIHRSIHFSFSHWHVGKILCTWFGLYGKIHIFFRIFGRDYITPIFTWCTQSRQGIFNTLDGRIWIFRRKE